MVRWSHRILRWIIVIALIGLALFPTARDQYELYQDSLRIKAYQRAVENLSGEALTQLWAQADAWNTGRRNLLIRDVFTQPVRSEGQKPWFEALAEATGSEILGSLEISSIGLFGPLYLSSGTEAVEQGCIFLEATSLPTGENGAHVAIAAQSGPSASAPFRGLHQLEEGDLFTVRRLDRTMTYAIDRTQTIQAGALKALELSDDASYCTLMTDQTDGTRLLLRGKRTDERLTVPLDALSTLPDAAELAILGVPIALVALMYMLLKGAIAQALDRRRIRRFKL
ncbi:MAG: sortase [Clostridia bacterium]|nr:sortase [Clostridia bacterium]